MLKYLVILLSNKSTSFCHYNCACESEVITISTDDLKAAILFGMKENLMIQFVYPEYELSTEHIQLIESIDHINIKPLALAKMDDIGIVNSWSELSEQIYSDTIVIRTSLPELISHSSQLCDIMKLQSRINIVLIDIPSIGNEQVSIYRTWLINFAKNDFKKLTLEIGRIPQLNLLTDRLYLNGMNNCNSGVDSITIGPDGRFYICPAFYNNSDFIGNPDKGFIFDNELLKIERAPICRICDAWQCKRCIWLNQKKTHELNTPSKSQCLISHAEREASRLFLEALREKGPYMPDIEITELDYQDPFEKLI